MAHLKHHQLLIKLIYNFYVFSLEWNLLTLVKSAMLPRASTQSITLLCHMS